VRGRSLIVDGLQLAGGLVLLVVGGRTLVSSASALAVAMGVSTLVIGLTVVAFGTSAPELAVNVIAAIRGSGEVAFGNLMGSNLANVGLIIGVAAIVKPLEIQGVIITREIPMMLLASLAVLVMGVDSIGGSDVNAYDRADGLLLFLFFAVFLYYTIGDTLRSRPVDPLIEQLEEHRIRPQASVLRAITLIVVGLGLLTVGGQLTVAGATGLAEALSVSDALIGLSVIAVGTSLPELSTSIIAARQGDTDLAVGNVVGSNIFNLLFVLATTSTIRPVSVPANGVLDLLAVVAMAVLLWVVCSTYGGRRVTHAEGWLLLVGYVGFIAARVA